MRRIIGLLPFLESARWAVILAALAAILLTASLLKAADPAFVGILAVAIDDDAAQRLALSDEVKEKLRQLVQKRENAATELVLSIKDLPPEERARRLGPFVQESERLGMELLTLEQRSKLSQLRLQRSGMASLAEPDMGQLLELSPSQQAEIRRLLGARAAAMTRGGEQDRREARAKYERELWMTLSDAQKATWDQMAGKGPGPSKVSEPAQAAEKTTVATPSEKPAADQPAMAADTPAATDAVAGAAQPATPVLPAADAALPVSPAGVQPAAGVPTEDHGATATAPATEGAPASSTAKPAEALPAAQQIPTEPKPAADAVMSAAASAAETPREPGAATPGPLASEIPPSPSDGTPAPAPQATVADEELQPKDVKLRFNFRFQPWGEVLDWLAEQADLSLQSSLVPEGTFNYSDNREYTPTEAIDLINGVLLTQGYTLVRRGRLLTILDLESEVPDVLVEFVPVEQLDERGEFELVKTVFHLAKMEPGDAEQEIGLLLGPGRSMVVMPKARQIMVTETAGKLRTIRDVIERAENPKGAKDKGVTEFVLKYVSPEEVLLTVRPLLGLAAGENVGEEISIAQDTTGKRLFAAGSKEKIQILEDLIERLDQERTVATSAVALEQLQLATHPFTTADPARVLAVLQTLLAGSPDVRLDLDEQTRKIIALARPSEHRTITETIKQLEGQAPHVEVIQLRRVDPQIAVLTIGKFFSEGTDASKSAIKIDADPTSMKLYVKATESEITEIKRLIEKLEGPADGGTGSGGNLRFIPLTGGSAENAVETARRLWLGPNRIQLTAPSESGPSIFDLKEISPERPAAAPRVPSPPAQPSANASGPYSVPEAGDKITAGWRGRGNVARPFVFFASFDAEEPAQEATPDTPTAVQETPPAMQEDPATAKSDTSSPREEKPAAAANAITTNADIRIEFTPNGVLITSEDTEALDRFEDLLRTVAGPQILTPGKNFTVYFLKFCKADVARQLIQDILGGTSSDGGGGSLMGDVASNLMGGGGGILGALLGGGGGDNGSAVTSVQATGPVTIVADSRLNCLVVQALPVDLQLVEQLLKVIDREGSITDIQTAGKPHIIPVVYMNAADVATVIKEAYAGRIATGASQGGGQPNPADLIRALRGGRGGRGGGSDVKSEESKMTIAVDARSNALIVTAPDQLYQEVKDLVTQIDQSGMDQAEEVHVVSIKNANPEAVQKALAAIMGQTRSSNSSSRTSNTSVNRPGGFQGGGTPFGATSGDIQNRINFMRAMQGAGGFQPGGGGGRGGFQPGQGGFGGRGGFQPGQGGRGGGGGGTRGGGRRGG